MKTLIATLAVAAGLLAPLASQAATETDALTTAARTALQASLGERAKDLDVQVTAGVAHIQGWALQPHDLDVARLAVSRVPGITQAYSASAHTWRATDRL